MSTIWPRWPTDAPAGLPAYVQSSRGSGADPGTPHALLALPVPAQGRSAPLDRARALYDAFAARRITYADEPASSSPGRQIIRTPYEVLHLPRHGTCLDLAVTYAGACLDARLHPLLLVTTGRPGAPAHALVAVWLGGSGGGGHDSDYRADELRPDWQSLPEGFLDDLADAEDEPGTYLVIDITAAARQSGSSSEGREPRPWAEAVARGARLLREAVAENRLRAALDIELGRSGIEPHPLPDKPTAPVLTPPYHPLPTEPDEAGPLKLLSARHDIIRFQRRDELDSLREYFQAADSGGARTRIALLHGTGGAGKTRLAAELAHQLAQDGWYSGFFNREPHSEDCAWLGRVASPLLVVVDYAEDHRTTDVINLLRVLRDREAPTCLLLTARSVAGWWDNQIAVDLRRTDHRHTLRNVPLAPQHPRQAGVYRSALRSFGAAEAAVLGAAPPADLASGPWTTLDLVMLAWLEAHFPGAHHPTEAPGLYEHILDHEFQYWERAYSSQIGRTSDDVLQVLREAGALLTLLAPKRCRIGQVLKGIPDLATDGSWRREMVGLFEDLLPEAPEDGTVAVRPDPVGTHLSTTIMTARPDLLSRCLQLANEAELRNVCVGISRFATTAHLDGGSDAAVAALDAVPRLWRAALDVATSQGGPFVRALERLAQADPTPLPLAELAGELPVSHAFLPRLALIATQRSRPRESGANSEESQSAMANWLNNLAVRQGEMGDRRAALESVTEAVGIRRTLAQDHPDEYLPGLATTLTNLSNQQSELGRLSAALDSVTEAVGIRRTLAESDPDTCLPDLALSLNNLSLRQAELDRLGPALASITEAVAIRRALAEKDPDEHLPDLATSLNNLALRQQEAGDSRAALESITRAVQICRDLSVRSPAAQLPALAHLLGNLAARQADSGRRQAALLSIAEAVRIRRALVAENPEAHLPGLASVLSDFSVHHRKAGDPEVAGPAITEAVRIRRALVAENPEAHLADLAAALNNLSNQLAGTGEIREAVAPVAEAVRIHRALVAESLEAHLPDLALSLTNLSVRQGAVGNWREALVSIREAVQYYRTLAEQEPAAYLPQLATALNNLASQQSKTGDHRGALVSAEEAVRLRRALVQRDTANLPGLAMSLNSLSVQQADSGDVPGSLVSVTEAVRIRRALVAESPAENLPELALELNNLAVRQMNVGEQQEALGSAVEAVRISRTLVEQNRAAHLPQLARALTTLSNAQSETGQPGPALESVTEAVTIRRALVEENPAVHLGDLALSLTNLSVHRAGAGQAPEALESITESVRIWRTLADQNPALHRPQLALALNNLSGQQEEAGEDQPALESITEAVEIRRALAADDPAVHLPGLASSLSNLSNRQADAGQPAAAMVTITEAVRICRALVAENRASHLPALAGALTNLSNRQHDAGDSPAAMASVSEAVELNCALALRNSEAYLIDLGISLKNLHRQFRAGGNGPAAMATSDDVVSRFDPGSAAALLTYRGHWRHVNDDPSGAVDDLLDAARRVHDTTENKQTGPARRAVRMLVELLREESGPQSAITRALPGLPDWATVELPEESLDQLEPWLSAGNWPEKEELLRQSPSLLEDGPDRALVAHVRTVYPEITPIVELDDLLRAVAARGLQEVAAEQRALHEATVLVDGWLAAAGWAEDMDHLRGHPGLATDPLARDLLASRPDDPAARQHLGILELADHLDVPEIYDAVCDPAAAADAAMDLIDRGNTAGLGPLLRAAPALNGVPFVAPYLAAVVAVCEAGHEASPEALFADAAREGTPVQRAAGAGRLRSLARHRPQAAAALGGFADRLSAATTD
ncbi:hypothetical protein GCM10018781_72720 [Kitasatospora indigofera]|uniref:Tetratricopeptide repeat protein n=1 Tax=Kitasatospora indigofera TaxID=67307 RepID=A0A919GHC8_9ACTN|nr:tetratricopeptide repeat protein [Kitasatospora indigofera]GHH84104.1 hypothetical protein GCM10018781_72720 [Kitasatospora indigofera]